MSINLTQNEMANIRFRAAIILLFGDPDLFRDFVDGQDNEGKL
jgi:hypothetical protein